MIEELDINLYEGTNETDYNRLKAEFISQYVQYEPGGIFSSGNMVNKPDLGLAKWNAKYPEGFKSWAGEKWSLTNEGRQNIINKVNELVREINKLKETKESKEE